MKDYASSERGLTEVKIKFYWEEMLEAVQVAHEVKLRSILRVPLSVPGRGCLGRVFNFKLGCFVWCTIAWPVQARPSLELKTRPRFRPVILS